MHLERLEVLLLVVQEHLYLADPYREELEHLFLEVLSLEVLALLYLEELDVLYLEGLEVLYLEELADHVFQAEMVVKLELWVLRCYQILHLWTYLH